MSFISSHIEEMSSVLSYIVSDTVETHAHPRAHIILPVEKTYYIRFGGRDYELTPRQIAFDPPNVPHAYRCNGLTVTLNVPAEMVKPEDLTLLTENCVVDIDEKLELLTDLIKQEVQDPEIGNESLRYLFYYLYDRLVERYRAPSLRHIHANYAGRISIAELAAIEGYSAPYYTDWFKKKMGCIPSEYIQVLRIEKAKELLNTTHYRVLDVALQVGYANCSSFVRAFKAVTGITPDSYRRQGVKD